MIKKEKLLYLILIIISVFLMVGCSCSNKQSNIHIPFDDELFAVKKDGKYGYIDTNGNTVIPFKYDNAFPFVGGVAIVAMHNNKEKDNDPDYRYYLIDKNENIKSNEYGGMSYTENNNNTPLFITGNKIVDNHFQGTMRYLIDKNGNEINSFPYDIRIKYIAEMNLFKYEYNNGYYGYMSLDGKTLFSPDYNYLSLIDEKGYIVGRNNYNQYKYIDINGEMIINDVFEGATAYNKYDIAAVTKTIDGELKCALIDRKGTYLTDFIYEPISYDQPIVYLNDSFIITNIDNKTKKVIMNGKGEVISTIDYCSIVFMNDYFITKFANGYRLYDKEFNVILDSQFDINVLKDANLFMINIFKNDYYLYNIYDLKGKLLSSGKVDGRYKYYYMHVDNKTNKKYLSILFGYNYALHFELKDDELTRIGLSNNYAIENIYDGYILASDMSNGKLGIVTLDNKIIFDFDYETIIHKTKTGYYFLSYVDNLRADDLKISIINYNGRKISNKLFENVCYYK